jgi:hypothetical protein
VSLPLDAIHNKRIPIAVDNLGEIIMNCIEHLGAANQMFLIGDGKDLPTNEFSPRMGSASGIPVRLMSFPVGLLTLVASLLAKKDVVQRLCGSLQVDI